MCWNSQSLGILATTTGFVFLSRADGGILYMSRMFGSHRDLEAYNYIMPHNLAPGSNFTISHMLYWFTHLTETTPCVVESSLAESIRVLDANRTVPSAAGPQIQIGRPSTSSFVYQQTNTNAPQFQYALQPVSDSLWLDFKPWVSENHCGGRAWYATILPEKQPVVVKCWDSYKNDTTRRDNEVKIYMKLQALWGRCVPKLIASGDIDFCHSILLERIDVFAHLCY
jgi:hypothetical protein